MDGVIIMYNAKRVYQGQPTATSGQWTTVTIPKKVTVKGIWLNNTNTTSTSEITIAVVPSGETLGKQHEIITAYEVIGRQPLADGENIVLEPGDTLYLKQSLASAISVYISGLEVV